MMDLSNARHHPVIDEIVEVLCSKTQNKDRLFFQAMLAYYVCKIAATMRATIVTKDRGEIPVNAYVLALATSGYGKGHAMGVIEEDILVGFQKRFMGDTMPAVSEDNLYVLGTERAVRNNSDPNEEFEKAKKEYNNAGSYAFTFDRATESAVKQLRQKLLLAGVGSINLQIDEIGSNLIKESDVLKIFLELYDQGRVKQSLRKNTAENQRGEDIGGKTPTNMMLFGTPISLFDGAQTEEMFTQFLETGYARRCIFGLGVREHESLFHEDPEDLYDRLISPQHSAAVLKWKNQFTVLADRGMYGWKMNVERQVGVTLLTYKRDCAILASTLKEFQTTQRAEIEHRYSKALKLAGAFAFIDQSNEVEMDHLMSAILLVEESGRAFQQLMHRDKPHVRLGKFLADMAIDVTQHDLTENLPFYKGGTNHKNDLVNMAIAWGYSNNVIIRKTFTDGIEFFRGEKLKETDLNACLVSYSDNFAYEYQPEKVPFDTLHLLTQAPGPMHWCNHAFKEQHRLEDKTIPGFNMVVLDVDGGTTVAAAHDLLEQYRFLTYTTKRHTEDENRFRLIMPINYWLELDSEEYKEFVNGIMAWLPFRTDEAANQRCKKWETFPGTYSYSAGTTLLDALPFIPKTKKNEQFKEGFVKLENLDNLERWFAQKMVEGNRNNHMIRFALALVDGGMDLMAVSRAVHDFNKKLTAPLDEAEIDRTILVSVAKRFHRPAA